MSAQMLVTTTASNALGEKAVRRAVGIFPDARLHIIKGAGHVFMTDAQQQEFLQEADEFLRFVRN